MASQDPNWFAGGWAGRLADGSIALHTVGDDSVEWTLQSAVKVVLLEMALKLWGYDEVVALVGFHGLSGEFNSIEELPARGGKPLNPFHTAGALQLVAALMHHYGGRENFLQAIQGWMNRRLRLGTQPYAVHRPTVEAASPRRQRNRDIAGVLKGFDRLYNLDTTDVAMTYTLVCSIASNLKAGLELFFHFGDGHDIHGVEILHERERKLLLAGVTALGSYRHAVLHMAQGSAGKTSVSGGVFNRTFRSPQGLPPGVSGWFSPGLDDDGNSLLGMQAAAMFSELTDTGMFD